jgi:spore coat polysaccharide biosynthesis predicted glycosyltransferase SpsG
MYVESQEQHTLKIAVVAGGSDPYGLVHKIAKILATFPEQFEANLFSDSILDSTLDSRFRCFSVGQHFDNLTKDVDLVITTASTSSLEFLARGLCIGIVCAVNNQEQYYKSLGELGVAAQLGFRNINNIWELDNEKIHSLVKSNELRRNLIAKAKDLIAFDGASRIVDAITAL